MKSSKENFIIENNTRLKNNIATKNNKFSLKKYKNVIFSVQIKTNKNIFTLIQNYLPNINLSWRVGNYFIFKSKQVKNYVVL